MIRRDSTRTRHFLVLNLCWCLATVALAAQENAPDGDMALPPAAIALELSNAKIRIVAGDAHDPRLQWWRRWPNDPGSAELSITRDGGAVLIRRGEQAADQSMARLLIEITMPIGKALTVHGSDLDLEVEQAAIQETQNIDPGHPSAIGAPLAFEIRLERSQAVFAGISGINGRFETSEVEIRETTGNLDLELTESVLRLVSHNGKTNVVAQDSDFNAKRTTGELTVQAAGGSIDLQSAEGSLKIETDNSQIRIIDSVGPGAFITTESTLDLRNSRIQTLNYRGASSHATVADCEGETTLNLTSGSFVADNLMGALTGNIRGAASLELTDQGGNVSLSLQEDTTADLHAIHGVVSVTSLDSKLTVQGAESFQFNGSRSRASVSAISDLHAFHATASDIDLDLSECRNRKPSLAVQAESVVRVLLATPCRVQAKGQSSGLARNIDVSGCELQLRSGGQWATRNVRGLDGEPPITLTVNMAETAVVTVDGLP